MCFVGNDQYLYLDTFADKPVVQVYALLERNVLIIITMNQQNRRRPTVNIFGRRGVPCNFGCQFKIRRIVSNITTQLTVMPPMDINSIFENVRITAQVYILTENCPKLQSKSIPLTTMNGFYPFLINDKYVYKTRSNY